MGGGGGEKKGEGSWVKAGRKIEQRLKSLERARAKLTVDNCGSGAAASFTGGRRSRFLYGTGIKDLDALLSFFLFIDCYFLLFPNFRTNK